MGSNQNVSLDSREEIQQRYFIIAAFLAVVISPGLSSLFLASASEVKFVCS